MTDLTKLQQIARLRREQVQLKEEIAALNELRDQTPEGLKSRAAQEQYVEISTQLVEIEGIYRAECVTEYNETGEKKLPGGQIKIYTSLKYDEPAAVDWCLAHEHGTLLKLDKSGFEKVAKELKPDIVTIKEEPKMTLSSDLSEFE